MKKTWMEQEQFALIETIGAFQEAKQFDIQPLFTWKQVDGQWELKGVYKLMVTADIAHGSGVESASLANATLIDEVDELDGAAYFEYALPFQIVIDAEKVEADTKPEFSIAAHQTTMEDGQIVCEWEACVSYQEATQPVESTSTYFEVEDTFEEWQESTIEFPEEVYVHPDQLPRWQETYTTLSFPIRSYHGGT